MRVMTELCRTFTAVAMLGTGAISASAQSTLDAGRSVTVELRDGRRITGRLVAGDSATITIDSARTPVVLNRSSIARLSARSYRSGPAKVLGFTGAAVGGLLLGGLASAFCGDDGANTNCGGAFLAGAGIGAVGAGGFMTIVGTLIGTAYPRWDTTASIVPVVHSRFSHIAPTACNGENQWSADVGLIQPRGYSMKAMGTFFCEAGIRSGIELGSLRSPISGSNVYKDATHVTYAGFVSERSIGHLSFDPRMLGSLQYVDGNQRIMETYRDAAGTEYLHDRIRRIQGPGFALAASAGINPTPSTSVRLEERWSVMPSGWILTLSLGGHWRP